MPLAIRRCILPARPLEKRSICVKLSRVEREALSKADVECGGLFSVVVVWACRIQKQEPRQASGEPKARTTNTFTLSAKQFSSRLYSL